MLSCHSVKQSLLALQDVRGQAGSSFGIEFRIDDVMTWQRFPHHLRFRMGIHWWPMEYSLKGYSIKFQAKYLSYTLEDMICVQHWDLKTLRFMSTYLLSKRPQNAHFAYRTYGKTYIKYKVHIYIYIYIKFILGCVVLYFGTNQSYSYPSGPLLTKQADVLPQDLEATRYELRHFKSQHRRRDAWIQYVLSDSLWKYPSGHTTQW